MPFTGGAFLWLTTTTNHTHTGNPVHLREVVTQGKLWQGRDRAKDWMQELAIVTPENLWSLPIMPTLRAMAKTFSNGVPAISVAMRTAHKTSEG
jgi:hypothetical protein